MDGELKSLIRVGGPEAGIQKPEGFGMRAEGDTRARDGDGSGSLKIEKQKRSACSGQVLDARAYPKGCFRA